MSDFEPRGSRHTKGTEKTRVLSGLTHELRTPLGSILMMSELLAENGAAHLDEREIRYAQNIHRATADLLELIDQLGELSRIEAGRVHLGERELIPKELGRHLEERYGAHAADAAIRLEVEIAQDTPAAVRTDGEKVARILELLVDSALKVSREGSVEIEMAPPDRSDGESGEAALEIRVRDSGPPLGDDERAGLFVPFGTAGARSSRQFGGSGLGLPLAHALAGLLGGGLAATSTPDGLCFTLRLPDTGQNRTRAE
jgi:signal transduction histidine kinase